MWLGFSLECMCVKEVMSTTNFQHLIYCKYKNKLRGIKTGSVSILAYIFKLGIGTSSLLL